MILLLIGQKGQDKKIYLKINLWQESKNFMRTQNNELN